MLRVAAVQSTLGNHLKTGHPLSLQNRPTEEPNQNNSSYTLTGSSGQSVSWREQRGALYWAHLGGGYGNAGMRPERRLRSRNGKGGSLPPCRVSHSGGKR